MRHWLLKSEPDVFSFQDLQDRPRKTEPWNGVRNYQARNFMRDGMTPGDPGLFYHSNTAIPGVAGVVRVSRAAYPDPTQFDPDSAYHDPKSDPAAPRWLMVDVTWAAAFPRFVSLETMKQDPALEGLWILRRGNRLSITPVDPDHFARICHLGGLKALPQ
jgi:predicted RNA-binding protein with PUA-like domain